MIQESVRQHYIAQASSILINLREANVSPVLESNCSI